MGPAVSERIDEWARPRVAPAEQYGSIGAGGSRQNGNGAVRMGMLPIRL
jgi:hypothetical protein